MSSGDVEIDRCAPLSHPSSCMLVNHGPLQQSSKEEYIEVRCYRRILHISYKDHVTSKEVYVPRTSWQSDHTKTS